MSIKIFAIPFAGSNKYAYKYMEEHFAKAGIPFSAVEYPGRGKRIQEPLLTDLHKIADDLYRSFRSFLNEEDYIIYGHSMGGLLGYLICKKIKSDNLKPPLKLVVSGCPAPSIGDEEKINHLPSNHFWKKIEEFGGLPKEILMEESLRNFFEPILRADFQAIESYKYDGKALLDIPIDVFYGSEEKFNNEQIRGWEDETNAPINFKELKGDHFFIFDHQQFFLDYFSKIPIDKYV